MIRRVLWRAPNRHLAELATPAFPVVPWTAQNAPRMPTCLEASPAMGFRVSNGFRDIAIRVLGMARHRILACNIDARTLVVKRQLTNCPQPLFVPQPAYNCPLQVAATPGPKPCSGTWPRVGPKRAARSVRPVVRLRQFDPELSDRTTSKTKNVVVQIKHGEQDSSV